MGERAIFLAGEVASKPAKKIRTYVHGGQTRVQAYVSSKHPSVLWMDRIREKCEECMHPDWPIRKPSPVFAQITAFKAKPASWSKNRNWWTTKPDRDNMEKLINDALKTVVMEDDNMVVAGQVAKVVCDFDGLMIELFWGPEWERLCSAQFVRLLARAEMLRGGRLAPNTAPWPEPFDLFSTAAAE